MTNPLLTTNRREFLIRAAAVGGVAALGGRQLFAADTNATSGAGAVPLAPPDRQPPKLDR